MLRRHTSLFGTGFLPTKPVGSVGKHVMADCSQSVTQNVAALAVFRTLTFAGHAGLPGSACPSWVNH